YFDGDEVHGTLVDTILRFMAEGEDFGPLVKFFENVAANPNDHSREQLYDWLLAQQRKDGGVTIDEDGMLVAYKGVRRDGDGSLVSGWAGKAIVDGVEVEGHIPNKIGSVIEMPRTQVVHDPASACSRGLHVGTFAYAKGYARGALLRVSVNPRDVVSVPTEAGGEKVRVCRYVVEDIITEPVSNALLRSAPAPVIEALDADVDVSLPTGDVPYSVGDTVTDIDGDTAIIQSISEPDHRDRVTVVAYYQDGSLKGKSQSYSIYLDDEWGENGEDEVWFTRQSTTVKPGRTATGRSRSDGRIHGKGGRTAAHGTGRHPAQDAKGRFAAGRPGSKRDKHGRFIG
ncbi:MAG: hypothetical protein K0R70_2186, partial [Steroidobacteraceae bacterium]|nr:hypothetical protein [Steroidobacteraceae bacterium]